MYASACMFLFVRGLCCYLTVLSEDTVLKLCAQHDMWILLYGSHCMVVIVWQSLYGSHQVSYQGIYLLRCFTHYTVINTHTVFCILLKLYACKIDRCCAPFLEMSVVISFSHTCICQIHQQTYEQNQRASLRYAQNSTRYSYSFLINYSRPPNVSCQRQIINNFKISHK